VWTTTPLSGSGPVFSSLSSTPSPSDSGKTALPNMKATFSFYLLCVFFCYS
jgi:hypothetical protein